MYPANIVSLLRNLSDSLLHSSSTSDPAPDSQTGGDCVERLDQIRHSLPPLPNDSPHTHECRECHHHSDHESDVGHSTEWISLEGSNDSHGSEDFDIEDSECSSSSSESVPPPVSSAQTEMRKRIMEIQTDTSIPAGEKSKKIQVCPSIKYILIIKGTHDQQLVR